MGRKKRLGIVHTEKERNFAIMAYICGIPIKEIVKRAATDPDNFRKWRSDAKIPFKKGPTKDKYNEEYEKWIFNCYGEDVLFDDIEGAAERYLFDCINWYEFCDEIRDICRSHIGYIIPRTETRKERKLREAAEEQEENIRSM